MKNIYYQFNFARYKPKNLEKLAKAVFSESLNVQPNSDKLQRLLIKLKNDEALRNSEVKFLTFFVSSIKSESLLRPFFFACKFCFDRESRLYNHVRGLLSSYYDDFQDEGLYKLLKYAIERNQVWKTPLIPVKELILKATGVGSFLTHLTYQFRAYKNITELYKAMEQFLIQEHHLIFRKILLGVLEEHILEIQSIEDYNFVKELIDSFKDSNSIKPAIEKFLLNQRSRDDFEDLPDHFEKMFELIGEKLGDAYGPTRNRWQGMSEEAKRIFTLWKTQKNIRYFFGEIMGDPYRLAFWKKYSHYIYRMDYFEKYDSAILMETNKHLIIEFAGTGAMHMYHLKDLAIDYIKRNPGGYGKTRMISVLKNKPIALTYKSHLGNWQVEFQWELKKYDYEMKV